jgi:Xaa-Pro aminopeptidase
VIKTAAPALLLYADTHASADMLYFGRVDVHDPFIALGVRGKKITVQSALEFGRVKKQGAFDTVLSREVWLDRARDLYGAKAGVAEIIAALAAEYRLRYFQVPDDFPTALYLKLTQLGLRLNCADGMMFPEREIKTPWEIAQIREGNRLCTVGYATAEAILRAATIKGRTLLYQGQPLTSERLRFALEVAIQEQGGNPQGTIVAGGDQACDPHHRGSGPLRPHELIIIDIFPRVVKTGYFGDMTRTYLKGRPSEAQRKLVATVREAQLRATQAIRANVDGREVHKTVTDHFAAAGYETKSGKNGSVGFFHGTGHGLGLAVHDPGRISPTIAYPLKKNSVLTVEPGLYYPGLGGCRWEDVVQVTATGTKPLSKHPYNWEIP